MVEPHKRVSSHLEYYLTLSKDIENVSRYIELCEDNYSVYSIELTRIMLTICAEIDVVAKQLCQKYEPKSKRNADNINCYRDILLKHIPKITEIRVDINRYSLDFVPWRSWDSQQNPKWWNSYNKVKHQRHDSYKEANLGNVLNALAGLCVLVCYFNSDEVKEGLNIRKPLVFLNNSYHCGTKALTSSGWELPE
ncbi:MAG: hypothetical protein JW795_07020 [Chitinivibrionales bacterium]|nr:hypothetical protein [Chitinivibrionales bacterium]